MDLLYKYFSNESIYAIPNLNDGLISFSPLETLNDPFEGVGSYLFQTSDEERIYWDSIKPDLPNLLSKKISDNTRRSANFKYRVFCSTKEYDNPLMWSYYANSHQGFCVGYAKSDIRNLSEKAQDIIYTDKMFSINDFTENGFTELLFQKSTVWQHEREYRALYRIKNEDIKCLPAEDYYCEHQSGDKIYTHDGYLQTNNFQTLCSDKYIVKVCKPAVIYLGLQAPFEIKKELIEIAHKFTIPLYQMIQEQNSFRLTYEELFYSM